MSRKFTLALLLCCLIVPVVGQNLGDQPSAGYNNARTYANVDLPTLRPPLRPFETISLSGVTTANSLAVFENQFVVGQPGSTLTPISYKMFNRAGTETWTQTMVGASSTFRYVPAVSKSLVILGGEGTTSIRAVSITDGSVVWSDSVGDTTGRFPAITDNYVIYAGSNKIAAKTLAGVNFWQQAVTTAAAAIAVRDDSLYFLTGDRTLWAIDLATKGQKWAPVSNVASTGASLIAAGKFLFINDPANGIVAAFDAGTGAVQWTQTGIQGTFATEPAMAFAFGRLYVFQTDDASGDAAVTAYDANTGNRLWTVTEPGGGLSRAFIADNTLYYYHAGEQIRARDAATGALLWSIAKTNVKDLSGANGELYVLLDNAIEVFRPSTEIFMPQLANGGGQTSLIMLANTSSESVDAAVDFYDEEGAPVVVSLRGYGNKSHLEVTIPENASLAIQTVDNGEELVVGWVRVVSDGLLRGTTSFQFSQADEIIREAGVADAVPTGNANLFVNVSGVFNAGVAIANPTEQDTQVTFRLLLGAEEVATKTLPLASGAHMANFLTELFPDEVGTSFEGTLVIESHIPVVITAIRTKGGLQISSYPVGQAVR